MSHIRHNDPFTYYGYKYCRPIPEQSSLSEEEILNEQILLTRIDFLSEDIQRLIGSFSPVVAHQRLLVKNEFFDRWITENTGRIMELVNSWSKPHVGFVLNRLIQLREPDFYAYLKGGICYTHWPATYIRKQIKVIISNRTKYPRADITDDLADQPTYTIHKFVPCKVNPTFNDFDNVRVYGAYKAIEEYDTRIKMKKGKKK
jgi:hypothetical protein